MDIVAVVEKLGTGAALVVMLWFVLKHFIRSQERFVELFGNHITHNTEVLEKLREVIGELKEAVERLCGKMK